jgi:membrane-bound metal-dependent hydrolase YbcI (DUF457 family)
MHPYSGWPFLATQEHATLTALSAVVIHGLIGLVVVLPIVLASSRRIMFGTLAALGSVALDLDHVVAAGSLQPRALETLGHRPWTHSLLFAVALTVAALILTRRTLLAWCAFAVLTSHLVFDAAGGNEYWLYPLKHPNSIPWLACPIGIAVLFGISAVVARARQSLPHAHPIDEHLRGEVGGRVR